MLFFISAPKCLKGVIAEGDKGAEAFSTAVHINVKSSPLNEVSANTKNESSVLVLCFQLWAEGG